LGTISRRAWGRLACHHLPWRELRIGSRAPYRHRVLACNCEGSKPQGRSV